MRAQQVIRTIYLHFSMELIVLAVVLDANEGN